MEVFQYQNQTCLFWDYDKLKLKSDMNSWYKKKKTKQNIKYDFEHMSTLINILTSHINVNIKPKIWYCFIICQYYQHNDPQTKNWHTNVTQQNIKEHFEQEAL